MRRLDGARERLTPVRAVHPSAVEYIAAKGAAGTAKRLATLEVQTRHGAERLALLKQQQAKRADLFKGTNWRGAGAHRIALRSVLAGQQAADKADLQERHQLERAALRAKHPAFPDVKTWATELDQVNCVQIEPLADQWRQRGQTRPTVAGDRSVPPVVQDIRAYQARIVRDHVQYTLAADPRIAFVDTGARVAIHQWRDPHAVHAALQLAAQKWPGGLTVNGPPAYLQECVRLATEQGFRINNPELQEAIQAARAVQVQARSAGPARGDDHVRAGSVPSRSR